MPLIGWMDLPNTSALLFKKTLALAPIIWFIAAPMAQLVGFEPIAVGRNTLYNSRITVLCRLAQPRTTFQIFCIVLGIGCVFAGDKRKIHD